LNGVESGDAGRWFNASSDNRFPDGMYALAMCLEQGYGCQQDETQVYAGPRKVDIRLRGKGNSNSHGARPVY